MFFERVTALVKLEATEISTIADAEEKGTTACRQTSLCPYAIFVEVNAAKLAALLMKDNTGAIPSSNLKESIKQVFEYAVQAGEFPQNGRQIQTAAALATATNERLKNTGIRIRATQICRKSWEFSIQLKSRQITIAIGKPLTKLITKAGL